jgi:hypothetical protein
MAVRHFEFVKMPAGPVAQAQAEFSDPQEGAPVHFDAAIGIPPRRWTLKHEDTDFEAVGLSLLLQPTIDRQQRPVARLDVRKVEDTSHDRTS